MTHEFKVGDKLIFNETSPYWTQGKSYRVIRVHYGAPILEDDDGVAEVIYESALRDGSWTLAETPFMELQEPRRTCGMLSVLVKVNEQGWRELQELQAGISKRGELAELYEQLEEIQRKIKEVEAK